MYGIINFVKFQQQVLCINNIKIHTYNNFYKKHSTKHTEIKFHLIVAIHLNSIAYHEIS